jgi:hypothetical protein
MGNRASSRAGALGERFSDLTQVEAQLPVPPRLRMRGVPDGRRDLTSWVKARPRSVARDFRVDDLLEALEALPHSVNGEEVAAQARTSARRVVDAALKKGVHPSRVVATADGVSIYFLPGGHAPPSATRTHAVFACDNSGEIAVLLSDRNSDFAQAFEVSMADLDDGLERIRFFLRHGPPR